MVFVMIIGFKNKGTEDIYNGVASKAARKLCPQSLWNVASRKLELLDSVVQLAELKIPLGNRLERLVGNRKGPHSIRINEQYRICFKWTEYGPDDVEVADYH
jgi:proteic killer suppression protein